MKQTKNRQLIIDTLRDFPYGDLPPYAARTIHDWLKEQRQVNHPSIQQVHRTLKDLWFHGDIVASRNLEDPISNGLPHWVVSYEVSADASLNHLIVNAFNAAIGAGIENHYGIVGQEWLAMLVTEREELNTRVPAMLETLASEIVGGAFSPQTRDVLYRCALVAVAGELATEYGLTGWESGDATAAAKRIFSDWLKAFGGDDSSREQRQDLTPKGSTCYRSKYSSRAYFFD